MDKKDLKETMYVKGIVYAKRSNLSLDETIKALRRGAIRQAVTLGLTKEEAIECITEGYKECRKHTRGILT